MPRQIARVTGIVTDVELRSGVSGKTGKPYAIKTAHVLVLGKAVTSVTLGDTENFAEGEEVDLQVDQNTYGQEVQSRSLGPWPALASAGTRSAASD